MLLNKRIEQWTTSHPIAWLDFLRISVGVFLFFKGFIFLNDLYSLQTTLSQINVDWGSYWHALGIAFVHFTGGIMIALGFFTRPAILLQIPVLIGAVIFLLLGFGYSVSNPIISGGVLFIWADLDNSLFNPQWWIALLTLMALLTCWYVGSGTWTVDNYLRNHADD
ncbi:DoxX family protein [Adhaeribacter aquaticus]|uniref:DoxX family protein n=1 Tax=Adhaeribacter aquaticus TaxID=299567 RepID=UPI0004290F99|nr:DoxX family protein [Adhaeribacter aquaticus]